MCQLGAWLPAAAAAVCLLCCAATAAACCISLCQLLAIRYASLLAAAQVGMEGMCDCMGHVGGVAAGWVHVLSLIVGLLSGWPIQVPLH